MATKSLKEIMDEIILKAKEEVLEKKEDGKFDPEDEAAFEESTDINVAMLITKNGVWAVGQPAPIIPELTVMFIFRERDDEGDIVKGGDAYAYAVPTKDKTAKGTLLSPTRLTIDGGEIVMMGEGMSLETFQEEAAGEIADLATVGDEVDPEETKEVPNVNGSTSVSTPATPAS